MKKRYLILGLSLLMLTGCAKQTPNTKDIPIIENPIIEKEIEENKHLKEFIITSPKENLKIHYLNKELEGTGSNLFIYDDNKEIYDSLLQSIYYGNYPKKTINVNYRAKNDKRLSTIQYGLFVYLDHKEMENVKEVKTYFYKNGEEIILDKEELEKRVDDGFYLNPDDTSEEANLYYNDISNYYGFDEMYSFVNINDEYVVAFYSKNITNDYRIEILLCYDYQQLDKDYKIKKFDDFTKDFFVDNFCKYTIEEGPDLESTYKLVDIKNQPYYMMIDTYKGEYYQTYFNCFDSDYEDENIILYSKLEENSEYAKGKVVDYQTYSNLCKEFNFEQKYTNESSNYFIVFYGDPHRWYTLDIVDFDETNEDYIDFYYHETFEGLMGSGSGSFVVIPTTKNTNINIKLINCFDEEKIEYLSNYQDKIMQFEVTEDKPVIYFYPKEDNTKVNVTLDFKGDLTCTYPTYNNGWDIIANKDGTIFDKEGQSYNYLYWEGTSNIQWNMSQGYCVKGSNTAKFLEEKLTELGLTRKEANEFIVYWLPKMQDNKYNIISFQGIDYDEQAKLNINPNPDTLIRVFMTYYSSDKYVNIKPQKITTPLRNGFTVVEWGGSEIVR